MSHKRRPQVPASSINITPLIDILLVLLVIFMVITPIDSTGLETALPQPPPPGDRLPGDLAIVVQLGQDGSIRLNRDRTDLQGVETRLRELFKTRRDRTVFIQANDELLFNEVAGLIDRVKGAGARNIGLLTPGATLGEIF